MTRKDRPESLLCVFVEFMSPPNACRTGRVARCDVPVEGEEFERLLKAAQ